VVLGDARDAGFQTLVDRCAELDRRSVRADVDRLAALYAQALGISSALALVEATLIAVPAVLVAPWLAAGSLRALNHVGPLADVGVHLEPHVTATSYLLAAGAGYDAATAVAPAAATSTTNRGLYAVPLVPAPERLSSMAPSVPGCPATTGCGACATGAGSIWPGDEGKPGSEGRPGIDGAPGSPGSEGNDDNGGTCAVTLPSPAVTVSTRPPTGSTTRSPTERTSSPANGVRT